MHQALFTLGLRVAKLLRNFTSLPHEPLLLFLELLSHYFPSRTKEFFPVFSQHYLVFKKKKKEMMYRLLTNAFKRKRKKVIEFYLTFQLTITVLFIYYRFHLAKFQGQFKHRLQQIVAGFVF